MPPSTASGAGALLIRTRWRGVPVPLVAEIAGHRSAAFTMGRYSHVLTSQYRDASDAMGSALTDPEKGGSGSKTG